MINKLKTMRANRLGKDESGFSLIDVVVTVAIIVAISVGGFIAYNGIVLNAKQGAVEFAATNVYRAAAAYENDGDDSTSACSAVREYNSSSEGIDVTLLVPDTNDESIVYTYSTDKAGTPLAENTYSCGDD